MYDKILVVLWCGSFWKTK